MCFSFWTRFAAHDLWSMFLSAMKLRQVTDNGVIMETDDEKISARIKMIDETEVTQSAQAQMQHAFYYASHASHCKSLNSQAEQMFQKATQSTKLSVFDEQDSMTPGVRDNIIWVLRFLRGTFLAPFETCCSNATGAKQKLLGSLMGSRGWDLLLRFHVQFPASQPPEKSNWKKGGGKTHEYFFKSKKQNWMSHHCRMCWLAARTSL